MKSVLFAASLALASPLAALPALAGGILPDFKPTLMLGLSYSFGGGDVSSGLGLTAKVLSSNKANRSLLAGGVTYYPWANQKLGLDAGLGVISGRSAVALSYDFLQKAPTVSLGYAAH